MARKLEELAEDEDDNNDDVLNIGGDIQLTGIDEINDDGSMKISSENIVLNDVLELPV